MNSNSIELYFHCAQCIEEKPPDISARDWQKLECGWTEKGLQVWCFRHDMNVIHLDFRGQKVGTV